MIDTAEKTAFFARVGRWVFPRRLLVPLPIVALGLLLIHPRRMFGEYETLGLVVSGLLVLVGMALRVWAGGCAGWHTRHATIEAPSLTTGGPYAFVRNPIYLGNMILGLGMIGLVRDPRLLLLYVPAFAFLYVMIVPAEEEYLRREFGEGYAAYCRAVPRIIPRLKPWPGRRAGGFDWGVLRGEAWIAFYLVLIYAAMMVAPRLRS
jgi:protein-S-isoprenylcysteine O-methyltransferase Ste14